MPQRDSAKSKDRAQRGPLSLQQINAGGIVARIGGGSVALVDQPAKVQAAQGDVPSLPTFSMRLYSGAEFRQWWSEYPLVLDLAGMELPSKPIPATGDHAYWAESTVGHIENAWVESGALNATGVFSGVSELRDQIVNAGRNGFPWQSSMGADVLSVRLVKPNETATVNGRTFQGPIYIVDRSRLREGAFTQLGADFDTTASVAAIAASRTEENTMEPTTNTGANPNNVAASNAAPPSAPTIDAAAIALEAAKQASAMSLAAERKRVEEVTAAAAGNNEIAMKAIAAGWDAATTAAAVVRAGRENVAPFNINAGRTSVKPTNDILAAAVCLAHGTPETNAIKAFGQQAVEAADASFRRISLRELIRACAAMDGIHLANTFGDGTEMIRAAASSISLPNVLESTARRTLLDAYKPHDIVAMQLCAKRPVSDFKATPRTRLLSNGQWEKVGKDGKVKHGRLGDQSFSAQADTKGEIVTLTRQDIQNDDLGAFLSMFTAMGIAAMNTIDYDFITLLLANAGSFIHANNANLISGGTSVFGLTGLNLLHQKFRKQKAGPGGTKDNTPVNIMPRKLFVPPEIEIDAAALLGSSLLVNGASSTLGDSNPFKGKYSLHSHPLLSDSGITGYSTTAFYLFADPAEVSAFELSLLNGVDTPTVMRAPTPSDVLGVSFVGYIDYGISAQDPRGVAKSAGA